MPERLVAEVAFAGTDHLGESPSWDAEDAALLRVDINAGQILRFRPETKEQRATDLGDVVGFAVQRRGGGVVAGARRSIVLVDVEGGARTVAEVEGDRADNRFNDAKCDPAGRLWAGTMSTVREPGSAALYRLDPAGAIERVLDGLTIANGLDWNADATLMYFIDSPTQRIDVLAYELDGGTIADRRPFVEIPAADGLPDGLTVDAEGGLWVALFGGGQVRRYSPAAELDAVIDLPVSNCTSVAFGGPGLDELFITSARHRLDARQLATQPLAGALFVARPGVRGRPPNRYGG